MSSWAQHLPVVPVVVPLLAGASMLLFKQSRRAPRIAIASAATLVQLVAAITLFYLTTDAGAAIWPTDIHVYAIGGWPAPHGIVLVVDRLSALMLVLTATLALPALMYSFAHWDGVGVHYHSLFQFLLMGLNGAFLTGDLFNLFVFFEVLLAASYGLLLHGAGRANVVRAGLHYIVVNLAASLAFLIGVAVIYGVAGTLNMADLAVQWAHHTGDDRLLLEAGAAILGIAFLVKAGSWPLNFWLPAAYTAAGAPVAAVFSIMTKVGVYAILRVGSLFTESVVAPFSGTWLFYMALATMLFGIVGMLASRKLGPFLASAVIVSSGTLLASIGTGVDALTAPALFYLLSSVLAIGAFFMLAGMLERVRTEVAATADMAPQAPVTYFGFSVGDPPQPTPADDEASDEVGVAIPAAMAFLGLAFTCCTLLVAGMPPLSGFVAKFALLSGSFGALQTGSETWAPGFLIGALLLTGLAAVMALSRIGMRLFWTATDTRTPRLRVIEAAPVAFLVMACIALTVWAQPLMSYLEATAITLHAPNPYIHAVLGSPP